MCLGQGAKLSNLCTSVFGVYVFESPNRLHKHSYLLKTVIKNGLWTESNLKGEKFTYEYNEVDFFPFSANRKVSVETC